MKSTLIFWGEVKEGIFALVIKGRKSGRMVKVVGGPLHHPAGAMWEAVHRGAVTVYFERDLMPLLGADKNPVEEGT